MNMKRSKVSRKRTTNAAKGKATRRSGVNYSPQLPPPPPPSVPTAEEETLKNGSPITISSQKDLENLVNNIEKNSQPQTPLSTPPVTKINKKNLLEEEEEEAGIKKRKRKSEEEKDEDYIETGEGDEDEEDSDFDDNVESPVVEEENNEEEEDEEENIGMNGRSNRERNVKKRTKASSKLPQAVRNRIAAQEFRQRQKTYIFELEQRVDALSKVNANVCYRLKILVHENSVLRYHLAFLRDFISKVSLPPPTLPSSSSTSPPKTQQTEKT